MEENINIEQVMDTPERSKTNQIATSISKFEDSPVFNFINSLSPIKPVKSLPISQTINPLTFASLPSVFTSPHVSSLSECRFLQRQQLSDTSRPEFCSVDTNTINKNRINVDADNKFDDQKEDLDPTASNLEVANECSKLTVEFSENLQYNNITSSSDLNQFEAKLVSEYAPNSSELFSLRDSYQIIDHNKEATSSCDWGDLISDPSDLLIFQSPNDTTDIHKKSVDPAMRFYTCIKHAIQNTLYRGPVVSENLCTQPVEESEMMECADTLDINGGSSITNPCENMDHQHLSGLYRGMKRRSLVFETAGARLNHLTDTSNSDSSMLQQSDENISSDQQQVPNSSQRALPGIGLHLNALTTTPKDYNIVNHASSASSRFLIGPGPFANFYPPASSGQELLGSTLPEYSLERETDNAENCGLPLKNSFRESCDSTEYGKFDLQSN